MDQLLSRRIRLWIAGSESWHTYKDFALSEESMAQYPFLKRSDDFYISLFDKFFKVLHDSELQKNHSELMSIAKGFEIYSLSNTKEEFRGINVFENILYSSFLYYLADSSASAWFLLSSFKASDFNSEIEIFIFSFLRRNLIAENKYSVLIGQYLQEGDETILEGLIRQFEAKILDEFTSFDEYISLKIALLIVGKFKENNVWGVLRKSSVLPIGEWNEFIRENLLKRSVPMWDFFPSQQAALENGLFDRSSSTTLQMPTSSGKTAISELLIYSQIKSSSQDKVLFLAPFRALASELRSNFVGRLAKLGVQSSVLYGGSSLSFSESMSIENSNLLITTPEKFIAIEQEMPDIYKIFKTIICDEGHLLDSKTRGLSYELLLSRFKSEGNKKFLFVSAIIPNIHEINNWLGGTEETLVVSNYKPTETEYAFLNVSGEGNFNLEVNPTEDSKYILNKLLTKEDFKYLKKGKNKIYPFTTFKTKSVAVALKALIPGPVALFSAQKGGRSGVMALAEETLNQIECLSLPRPAQYSKKPEKLVDLKQYFEFLFGSDYPLTRLVENGAAFHHGDLPQEVREVIEEGINDGTIRLIICTSTLAEGVNLPIKTIVLHSVRRFEGDESVASVRDIKNIVGRAGRACKETKGFVIATNPGDFGYLKNVIKAEGYEESKGRLFEIVEAITAFLAENKVELTEELIASQPEYFQELIDSIDMAIVDLLTEEIEPDDIPTAIAELVKNTFAYHQSDDSHKSVLSNLFGLRGEKLKSEDFKIIKESGSTPRLYRALTEVLDINNTVWENTVDPLSPDWLSTLFPIVFSLPQITHLIENRNDVFGKYAIGHDQIQHLIILWIEGKTYQQIALELNIPIEILLRIFSVLINFRLETTISSLVKIAKIKLEKEEKIISPVIESWSKLMMCGLNKLSQLELVELGFVDRFGIIAIDQFLSQRAYAPQDRNHLRNYLVENAAAMIPDLEVPQIIKSRISKHITQQAII